MPFVYAVAPGSSLTTSGSANTEVDHLFLAVGATRNIYVQAVYVMGKGATLTSISGIAFRGKHWTTASTAGTSITPKGRDDRAPASVFTAAHTPTAGSGGGTYWLAIGCGAAGPGGWVAPNPDSMFCLSAASGDSADIYSASGATSLSFELSAEVQE
jgi:hypothetical protein